MILGALLILVLVLLVARDVERNLREVPAGAWGHWTLLDYSVKGPLGVWVFRLTLWPGRSQWGLYRKYFHRWAWNLELGRLRVSWGLV